MKKIVVLFYMLFAMNVYSQLTPEEQRQVLILKQAAKEIKEQEAMLKKAEPKSFAIVQKMIYDTIVQPANFADNDGKKRYENFKKIGVQVKDGYFYVNFMADVVNNFTDFMALRNDEKNKVNRLPEDADENAYRIVSAAPPRIIDTDNNKQLVYVTPAIPETSFSIWSHNFSFGLLTVPFKIRPKRDTIPSESKADIKNIGLLFAFSSGQEIFYYDGSKSSHKYAIGLLTGPSVETLNAKNTKGRIPDTKSTNQFYWSSSLALTYTYNDLITIAFLPMGVDKGISTTSKKWIYDSHFWWGFGIGLDVSKLASF